MRLIHPPSLTAVIVALAGASAASAQPGYPVAPTAANAGYSSYFSPLRPDSVLTPVRYLAVAQDTATPAAPQPAVPTAPAAATRDLPTTPGSMQSIFGPAVPGTGGGGPGGGPPATAALVAAGGDLGRGGGRRRPQSIGDLPGLPGQVVAVAAGETIGGGPINVTPGSPPRVVIRNTTLANYGAFKIGENESPRPTDRLIGGYNYYNRITAITQNTFAVDPGVVNSARPGTFRGEPAENFSRLLMQRESDLHRATFGFEKTLPFADASVELRASVITVGGGDGGEALRDFTALTVVTKFVLAEDEGTGDLLSGGLAVTVPTGNVYGVDAFGGSTRATLLQPYVAYIYNLRHGYLQGFTSFVFPTDERVPTLFFTSLTAGLDLYCSPDSFVTTVTPVVEFNLTSGLSNRGPQVGRVSFQDTLSVTTGVHFGLGDTRLLTVAANTPVTGPRIYDYELIVQFNCGF